MFCGSGGYSCCNSPGKEEKEDEMKSTKEPIAPTGVQNVNILELLLSTERKGQRLIEEAKLRKARKLKQAKEEANAEANAFRQVRVL